MNTQLNPLANPFQFDALDVRTAVDDNNDVWFCAKDVCSVLGILWDGHTLDNIPENWFMMVSYTTIKGERDTNFINEAGLYKMIFRSNKPKAEQFANWVCEEVLPNIRRHGFFGTVKPKDYLSLIKHIDYLTKQVVTCKNVFQLQTQLAQLRTLHNLAGSKMPALELVNADIEQSDLFLAGVK